MNATDYKPELIKTWRGEVSQEVLAKALGVHRHTIWRAERGVCASFGLLSKIAKHFRKPVIELLRD